MKRALLGLCVACCIMSGSAIAEDLREHLSETRKLVRDGKYSEALERFEWVYANAPLSDPAEGGIPTSTIVRSWHDLAEKHPPAMVALHEVRNRTIHTMLETGGTFALMQEVGALNREFKCEHQTIDLFEQVIKKFPTKAHRYWIVVQDDALAAERYDLAATYMPDLELEFVQLKTSHELLTAMVKRRPADARITKMNEDRFVTSVQQLITVGLKIGKPEIAAQVQKEALAVIDDPRIRDAIPKSVADEPEQPQNPAPPEGPAPQPAIAD